MKKLLSLLIVAVMVFATFSSAIHISAETVSGTCGENLTWELDTETGVLRISGTGDMNNYYYSERRAPWSEYTDVISSVEIASGVTSIGECAFINCDSLTSVLIPDGVLSIGNSAFEYCRDLADITLPDSLIYIGSAAFYSCGIKSIKIPDGVTAILDSTFSYCDLENIYLPYGLKSIGDWAFDCCNIYDITIPESVTSIGSSAFWGCPLTEIVIPASVEWIGDGAFTGCNSLEAITVEKGNKIYHSFGNCLIETETKTLIAGCKNSVIPSDGSVTTIGHRAFYCMSNLESITIPEGAIAIEESAFGNCYNLKSLSIPDSVTSVGLYAFESCNMLDFSVYDNAKYLGNDKNPFLVLIEASDPDIVSCVVNEKTKVIADYAFAWTDVASVTIPEGVMSIGGAAFDSCTALSDISIPDSVTSIGERAFYDCSSLRYNTYDNAYYLGNADDPYVALIKASTTDITSVAINPNTKVILNNAFRYCYSLGDVVFPDGLRSIGDDAFSSNDLRESVTIPGSVEHIGYGVFSSNYQLENITVAQENEYYHSAGNCLIETGTKKLIAGCNNSVIPSDGSVTSIAASAFSGCTKLAEISIPGSVTSIGTYAFDSCYSLTSITIPKSVTHIGEDNRDSFNINPLCYCHSLETITVEKGNIKFHSSGNCLIETGTYTLIAGCKNSVIPSDGSVRNIKNNSFYGCRELTGITIPGGVTRIGQNAFTRSGLKYAVIPRSVVYLGAGAFYYCNDLSDIYYIGTEAEWNTVYIESQKGSLETANIHYGVSSPEGHYALTEQVEATCTNNGYTKYECPCGYAKTEYVYSTGHVIGEFVETVEPTCTEYGYSVYKCSVCGENFTPYWTPPKGHSAEVIRKIDPSCHQVGSTVNRCTVCGEAYITAVKSAFGHTFENGVCTVCGKAADKEYDITNIPEVSFRYREKHLYNSGTTKTVTDNDMSTYETCYRDGEEYHYISIEFLGMNLTRLILITDEDTYQAGEYTLLSGSERIVPTSEKSGRLEEYSNAFCVELTFDSQDLKNILIDSFPGKIYEIKLFSADEPVFTGICGENVDWTLNAETGELTISGSGDIAYSGTSWFYDRIIKKATILPGVTSIPALGFAYLSEIETVNIPDSVVSIGGSAFYWDFSLKTINIPDGVSAIKVSTFSLCHSMKSITIPNSVTAIDTWAFNGCAALADVYFIGTEEEWNAISISNIYNANDQLLNANIHYVDDTLKFSENDVTVESAFDPNVYGASLVIEKNAEGANIALVPDGYDRGSAVVYDVYFEKDDEKVQPSGEVTVKIPVPAGMKGKECKVFWISGDSAVDMNAEYIDGYLVFVTDHFSYYVIVEEKQTEILLGDADGNGSLNMKDVLLLRKVIAGSEGIDPNLFANADLDGNGDINMKDVLKLRKIIAGVE